MTLEAFMLAIIMGIVAGSLAGFVMRGDSGLIGDVLLGIGGSIVGGWLVRTFDIADGSGWFAMIAAAFVGATILLSAHRIAQRMLWPLTATRS